MPLTQPIPDAGSILKKHEKTHETWTKISNMY